MHISFPNLVIASTVLLQECEDIFLPVLTNIGNDLRLSDNSILEFSAPKLNLISGSVQFSANQYLRRVDLPGLVTVAGDILVTHNPMLLNLSGFGSLAHIPGDEISFTGNFS